MQVSGETPPGPFPMSRTSRSRREALAESPVETAERDRFTRREQAIWRSALLLIGVLATGLTVAFLGHGSRHALPAGAACGAAHSSDLVHLVRLGQDKEIADLRGLAREIEHRAPTDHDNKHLDQLFALISKSQQGYRDLIDTIEDQLFSISLDGKILTINRSFAGLLGRPFAELIGRPLDDFIEFPETGGRMAAEQALPSFLSRRSWSGVVRARIKHSGSMYYFDCVLHPIVHDGVPQGISGLARDVTLEREKETRFTEYFETLREGVYLASADDRITEVNPALAQMLGLPAKQELIGLKMAGLYLEASERVSERARLDEMGSLRAREITLSHRQDGREVAALHTTVVVRDHAGRFVRYQGTFVDITEQREMKHRLHREQEFASRLMDSFPDVVVALDADLRYTFASPRITDVLGYQPEDLLGKKLGGRTDPEDREAQALIRTLRKI